MVKQLRATLALLAGLTLLTGVGYPGLITGLAQLLWPFQANGSLIYVSGAAVGSELIGQSFSNPGYFWSRPSLTDPEPYNAAASAGANFGPEHPAVLVIARERLQALQVGLNDGETSVPVDLVTASGSGLDPHISPAAAYYQVARVAAARQADPEAVRELVERCVEKPQWGFLGEGRVSVLRLNLALDETFPVLQLSQDDRTISP